MTKHFLRTCLILLLCVVMLTMAAGAVSQGGVTTRTAVNVRTGAGTSNSIIATVPAGTTLISGGQVNGWYKVVYNGTVGYVSGDYVTPSNSVSGNFGTGTVVASAVNLRSGPSTSSGVITTLYSPLFMSLRTPMFLAVCPILFSVLLQFLPPLPPPRFALASMFVSKVKVSASSVLILFRASCIILSRSSLYGTPAASHR